MPLQTATRNSFGLSVNVGAPMLAPAARTPNPTLLVVRADDAPRTASFCTAPRSAVPLTGNILLTVATPKSAFLLNAKDALLKTPKTPKTARSTLFTDLDAASPDVAVAPAALADNAPFVTRLADLINAVYDVAEAGFWDAFSRTTPEDMATHMRAGNLLIAWRPGTAPRTAAAAGFADMADYMGSAVAEVSPGGDGDGHTGHFSMLVCRPELRGMGVGRQLLRQAEVELARHGAAAAECDLMMPDGWDHAFKRYLASWYEHAGYAVARTAEPAEVVPQFVPLMARPSMYRIYRKPLVGAGAEVTA